jgi:YD repeat-containing protein
MNCRGCGLVLDPSSEQVNSAIDDALHSSIKDAAKRDGVCPLCGHSQKTPVFRRRPVQFALLMGCLVAGAFLWFRAHGLPGTRRSGAVADAVARMNVSADVVGFLGSPIAAQSGLQGEVEEDETGWQEVRLLIPVKGPRGEAIARVTGGRVKGPWNFSSFEVILEQQRKRVDLISGRVIEYDPSANVDVHTLPAAVPEFVDMPAPPARLSGEFPCLSGTISSKGIVPSLGTCSMPTAASGPVDDFEVDLRYGRFVLRETDLYLDDVFKVPLTRTYNSNEWASPNPVHAFGRNTNHPYDIAPLGSRNPYTWLMLVLENGDFLYFDRVSRGTGYANAVYRHTETASPFYKAIQRWNGNGWTLRLADGSQIIFPESYNAKNLAQGAPIAMLNPQGDRLELVRDAQRNLHEIRTPHGHWIRFTYDERARVSRAEDDAGNWVEYKYQASGMLASVVRSSGSERHFEYDGSRMTGLTDESKNVLLRNWYGNGDLVWQKFGDRTVYSYHYDRSLDRTYIKEAHVTLPDQSIKDVPVADDLPDFVRKPR